MSQFDIIFKGIETIYLRCMLMIDENIKIKDLQLISLLDRFSSLRSIARHIEMEPQNLSKKLILIEDRIGFKLLERSSKGFSLTSQGQRTVSTCRTLLQQLNQINLHKDKAFFLSKHLNICSRGFLINYLCPYLVTAFSKEQPETGLRFMDLSPEATENAARNNQVNVTLSFGEIDLGRNWTSTKVGELNYCFVVNNSHPLNGTVTFGEFSKYPFIGVCYIDKSNLVLPQLTQYDKEPLSRGYDSENVNYTKSILSKTLQIGHLPRISVINEINQGHLKTIELEKHTLQPRKVLLHTHIDQVKNKDHEILQRIISNAFKTAYE